MDLRQGPHRALGPVRQARPAAEIRHGRISDGVVVGRGEGREDGIPFVRLTDAPQVLTIAAAGAGTLALHADGTCGTRRATRHLGIRRSANIPRISRISITSIRTRRKAVCFRMIGSNRQYNQNFLTFNSLNSYILRGDAALGMERTFTSLMTGAADEPDSMYGLAAQSVQISEDGLVYRFTLRPDLVFHDGSALDAHDVVFSLTVLKEKGHPIIQALMRDFDGAEAIDDRTRGRALQGEARPRRAAVRGRAADLFARLLRQAAVRGIQPRCPARQRALQGRPVRSRTLYRIRPGEGLVGRKSPDAARPATISMSSATSSFATATSRSKASPAKPIPSARNSPPASGRRATTFRPCATGA